MTLFCFRKACTVCRCSREDHAPNSDFEDDQKIGLLLADSRYSHLTAKVKGGDGMRVYKRNRMIITNPVVSRKDPTFHTITYEWAPPGLTQKLVSVSRKPTALHDVCARALVCIMDHSDMSLPVF